MRRNTERSLWLATIFTIVCVVPALASVYRFSHPPTGARPPFPAPQFILVDTAAELPSAGVREGDTAYAKDDDKVYKRTAAAWADVSANDAEYWVNTAHAGLSAEKVLGTASGTIEGLCIGQAGCTPVADTVSVIDPDFHLGSASGNPALVFDGVGDHLSYARAANTFLFQIANISEARIGASGVEIFDGLIVGFPGTPVADQVRIGDDNFILDFNTGNPKIVFDNSSNDALLFSRGSDQVDFNLASISELQVTTSGIRVTDGLTVGSATTPTADAIDFEERTDPAVAAADHARLYAKDNGSGKTQLCVIFSSGATQCFATQP